MFWVELGYSLSLSGEHKASLSGGGSGAHSYRSGWCAAAV